MLNIRRTNEDSGGQERRHAVFHTHCFFPSNNYYKLTSTEQNLT